LVRDDSPFVAVGDLRGARVAWADPSSASGHLFARLHLLGAGIDPPRDLGGEKFLGSAEAACAAVSDGKADLCACYVSDAAGANPLRALADVRRTLGAAAAKLRVLAVTASIPPDGVVLAPTLDGWRQAKLRDTLLALHERTGGARAIAELMQAERLAPVTNELLAVLAGTRRLRRIA